MVPRTRPRLTWSSLAVMLLVLTGCVQAPITGRDQLILIPDFVLSSQAQAAFDGIKQETGIVREPRYTGPVKEIGRRIAGVAPVRNANWEFVVFDSDEFNAFAMPGGKVGVYRGMFDVAESDDQLATVMAHEVAHVAARHGGERVTTQLAAQLGIALVASATDNPDLATLLAQAATLGVVLPFSRTQEAEADRIGLELMARAGYDPRAAVPFWQNMMAKAGSRRPEFLATHPNPKNRIRAIEAALPQVMPLYEASPYRR